MMTQMVFEPFEKFILQLSAGGEFRTDWALLGKLFRGARVVMEIVGALDTWQSAVTRIEDLLGVLGLTWQSLFEVLVSLHTTANPDSVGLLHSIL